MLKLKKGDTLVSPLWSEPLELLDVQQFDGYLNIKGVLTHSRKFIDDILSPEDLEKIEILDTSTDFSADPETVFYYLEALRFRYASIFDPLLALNVSKIEPLPFQIDAVYNYILRQPQVKFLLADDPGAGKTIMAGLVIKELKLRGLASRILIVVPGHLKAQWQREMKEKFSETFTVIDRWMFKTHYGENPWEKYNQVITSIDFAKQDDILVSLGDVLWDLVIVDEAHKMAAYKYGKKLEKTKRYKLGEILSNTTTHLLFLTATPHKGDPENFRLFIDLLLPGAFATEKMLEEALKQRDNPIFLRRLKEDLKDFEGRPIFTRRFPKTIKFKLSDEERELYNDLSRYISEQYNRIPLKDRRRNVAFALTILQRRMASSTYALLKSLERRRNRLERLARKSKLTLDKLVLDIEVLEEVDELEEVERWKREEDWESLTTSRNSEELKGEIEILNSLIDKAYRIICTESEIKLRELKKAIQEGFKRIEDMRGAQKILIFTESRDTLEYLFQR